MSSTVAVKNTMLDALTIDTIKLHSADPAPDGVAGQISGASAACSFNAAANGSRQMAADVPISIPAGTTVTHYSLWNGSTYLMSKAFTTSETFSNAGTANILASQTSIDLSDV